MSYQLKAINDFHNTETMVHVVTTYETKYEGIFVAVVRPEEITKASMALCGIKDCTCGGIRPNLLADDKGRVYHITTPFY